MRAYLKKVYLVLSGALYPLVFSAVFLYERFLKRLIRRAHGEYLLLGVGHKGVDVRIHGRGTIVSPKNLLVGDYTRIGEGCYIHALGGVKIGSNCQISRQVTIYSANHNYLSGYIPYDNTYVLAQVEIGDSVWIGMNVSILPGVRIGEGSIIGMNTVVSKDVEPYSIIVGSGQRKVGQRDIDEYKKMKEKQELFGLVFPDH